MSADRIAFYNLIGDSRLVGSRRYLAAAFSRPTLVRRRVPSSFRQNSHSKDLVDFARQEQLDLSIAYGEPPTARGVSIEPLGLEAIAALAAPHVALKYDLTESRVTIDGRAISSKRRTISVACDPNGASRAVLL